MAEEQSKGLPMTAKWDPEKLEQEVAELKELESRSFVPRAGGYIKRTGPGLLQSAMTLGAGSATASVVAGASFGYKLLWVQPVAMFLGVMMLAALGNIVLSTGERPYKAFGREMSKVLIFLWALGTIAASIIWHFPQYGLAAGAMRDLGKMAEVQSEVELVKLPDGTYATQADEETLALVRGDLKEGEQAEVRTGVAKEEWDELKLQAAADADLPEDQPGSEHLSIFTRNGVIFGWIVGGLILCINIFTVFSYGSSTRGIKLYEWFLRTVIGLIIVMFAIVVASKIDDINWTELGKGFIGWYGIPGYDNPEHVTLVLGMLGAAVGINMTFLYPYSLLAKGWGKHHKKLARWDLGMSMFLPFALVTSLVIIAMTTTGVYSGEDVLRGGLKPVDASESLHGVLGENAGRIVFDLGLIAMCCSAISTHMVVCGFTFCEMLGLEYTKLRFRIFALAPAIGIFGVVAKLPFWFPVAASAVCFAMLPIAYLIFYLLNNKEKYLGEGMMKWPRREFFNILLIIALFMSVVGSVIQINNKVVKNEKVRAFFGLPPVTGPAEPVKPPVPTAPTPTTTPEE